MENYHRNLSHTWQTQICKDRNWHQRSPGKVIGLLSIRKVVGWLSIRWFPSLTRKTRTEPCGGSPINKQPLTSVSQRSLLKSRKRSAEGSANWGSSGELKTRNRILILNSRNKGDRGQIYKIVGHPRLRSQQSRTPHIQLWILGDQWSKCSRNQATQLSYRVTSGNTTSWKDKPSSPQTRHGAVRRAARAAVKMSLAQFPLGSVKGPLSKGRDMKQDLYWKASCKP